MPATVFVSYSHKEADWRQKFQTAMGGGVYENVFNLWFDDHINASDEWKQKINGAIGSSRIALLLVGNGFLNSSFIARNELPKILDYRKAGLVKIFWVPIHDIPIPVRKAAGLDRIQWAWPPEHPLSTLEGKDLDDALMLIATNLINAIELDDIRDDIRPKVAEIVSGDITLGESFAAGDYSLFYRATLHDQDIEVAVKALIPTPKTAWLHDDFVKRANIVRKITNSTAINIREVISDARLACVVMDLLIVPTLESRLLKDGRLSSQIVANTVGQLARLAAALHTMDGQPIIGPVLPSHVHYDDAKGKAFISLLPISSETLDTSRKDPTRLLDASTLAYLSPERFYGKPISDKTDQYYLALLALELLQGKPPVPVETFADLQKKAAFFRSPRKYFDDDLQLNQPALCFILTKMLETKPGNRWESLDALVAALQEVANGKVPEVIKEHADAQYHEKLRKKVEFFQSFYRLLFERSAGIKALFQRHATMEEQSQKLDKAMRNILNFSENLLTSSLDDEVDYHRGMGIKTEYFGLFRDAFLDALREAKITDSYSQDAWRAILDPALNYMRVQIGSTSRR